MAAKVLKMDGGAAKQAEDKDVRHRRTSYYVDDRTARYLLVGKDERGKAVYFIRVGVTGLRRRVFGPYRSKGQAILAFDGVLGGVLQAFIDLANEDAIPEVGNQARLMIELPTGLALVE
jgi:hypothetical protein